MSRTSYYLALPLALVLLAAPSALAQVPADAATTTPMTEAQVQEARADLQTRMDRLDRDFRDLERQTAAITDPQRRADMDRQMDQLRQQRDELRTQADELATASANTFAMERQDLMDRYNELDRSVQQARLSAASTPRTYQRVSEDHLDRFDQDLARMNQRLDDLSEADRSRYAYDLIQLRKQRDQLANQTRRLARVDDAEFDTIRRQQTEALTRLNNDLHNTMMEHDALMADERMRQVRSDEQMHGGGQMEDRDQMQDRDPMDDGNR